MEDVPRDVDDGRAHVETRREECHLRGGIDQLELEIGNAECGDDTSARTLRIVRDEEEMDTHATAMSCARSSSTRTRR